MATEALIAIERNIRSSLGWAFSRIYKRPWSFLLKFFALGAEAAWSARAGNRPTVRNNERMVDLRIAARRPNFEERLR
jgi:hypothetical protein